MAELEERFSSSGYGDLKSSLAEAIVEHLTPIRERYEELLGDREELLRLLKQGAGRAREVAEPTLAEVRELTGLLATP